MTVTGLFTFKMNETSPEAPSSQVTMIITVGASLGAFRRQNRPRPCSDRTAKLSDRLGRCRYRHNHAPKGPLLGRMMHSIAGFTGLKVSGTYNLPVSVIII